MRTVVGSLTAIARQCALEAVCANVAPFVRLASVVWAAALSGTSAANFAIDMTRSLYPTACSDTDTDTDSKPE